MSHAGGIGRNLRASGSSAADRGRSRRHRRRLRPGRTGSWHRPEQCSWQDRARTAWRRLCSARAPQQRNSAHREVTKVDGVAAMSAADGDRDVLGTRRDCLGIPLAQHPEPPDEITSTIAARWAIVRADGQVDAPARHAGARPRSAHPRNPPRPPAPRHRVAGPGLR